VKSQLAVPAAIDGKLVLVLFAEDLAIGRFSEEDAHCLQLLGNQLAAYIHFAPEHEEQTLDSRAKLADAVPESLTVRYYQSDDSVFFGDQYVVKSLPGRILFKLLFEYKTHRRTEFTKKELRLDPALKLPAIRDNLDTRLILLSRRLDERFPYARIRPSGRGKFLFEVDPAFELCLDSEPHG
jgi:adenylate cyclase